MRIRSENPMRLEQAMKTYKVYKHRERVFGLKQ